MAYHDKPICDKCDKEMQLLKTDFAYLAHSFSAEIYRCPECGIAYIPEELVKGRIGDVEMMLEDK